MGSLSDVRRLVAYDRSVLDAYARRLARMPWKVIAANREIGHRSMKNTLVHILNVYEAWFVAVAQGRWEIFERKGRRPDECRSWKDVRAYHRQVWVEVDRFVAGLTPRSLHRRLKAPWMPGRYTVEDAIYQASFEQAHHLGEIIGVLWQQDSEPPAMTWIQHMRRGTARARRRRKPHPRGVKRSSRHPL